MGSAERGRLNQSQATESRAPAHEGPEAAEDVQTLQRFHYLHVGETNQEFSLNFLQWNSSAKTLEINQDQTPVSITEVINSSTRILVL